jgi:hypothetical protein
MHPMRKLILAATALAFVSSTALAPALAQDKAGTTGTAVQSGDATSKGDKMAPKKTTSKKVSKAKIESKSDTAK